MTLARHNHKGLALWWLITLDESSPQWVLARTRTVHWGPYAGRLWVARSTPQRAKSRTMTDHSNVTTDRSSDKHGSHFYSNSFLSAGKQSEMSKRSQESSSPGSPTVKAKAYCLVLRLCVSVGQDYSSNPKSPGEYKRLSSMALGKRNEKSGWYSVQHPSGNGE